MNAFGKWATLGGVALVLAISYYAVWQWARADLKLEWTDTEPEIVVTVKHDTTYMRDTVQSIRYVTEIVLPDILKPIVPDTLTQAMIDTTWSLLVRVLQPARETLDTLGITGTVDYEPYSRQFYNNLALIRAWQDTTRTKTLYDDGKWDIGTFSQGAIIGGIVFALLVLWAQWGG